MSVQFQFVDRTTPMGANLVAGGATFRTWAPRARNVYLLTGDALSLSATAGWTPDPGDCITALGDDTWAGFVAGAAFGPSIYVLDRRRSLAGAEARPLRPRTDAGARFPRPIASFAIPQPTRGMTEPGEHRISAS